MVGHCPGLGGWALWSVGWACAVPPESTDDQTWLNEGSMTWSLSRPHGDVTNMSQLHGSLL